MATTYGTARTQSEVDARRFRPPKVVTVQQGALVENFIHDPALCAQPGARPALFSDHGVTHVRDIAGIAAELANRNDGVLIPRRSEERVRFISSAS